MFTTYDSTTYVHTSNEFYKFSEIGFSNFRPFLFPLILLIVLNTIGVTGLWLMQVVFWFVAVNLLYFSIKRATDNKLLGYIGALLMATNFSLLGLTMQCLTEVTTILLLSFFLYTTVVYINRIQSLFYFHRVLILFVLLSVVKPVFYIPLLFILFIILPLFYLKKYKNAPRKIIILFALLLPLFFQLTLMKVKYNVFTISLISSETFRNYLFAQGMQQNELCSLSEAREKITSFTSADVNAYVFENKALYFSLYLQNLKSNLNGFSSFLIGPRGFIYTGWAMYMTVVNTIYFYLHILFIVPLLLLLYYLRKRAFVLFLLLLIPLLVVYYIFLTSPVSFNEGDRLIITTLPLWIFVYLLAIHCIVRCVFKNKENSVG
ncbi:MAG: hypothetical protein WBM13_08675 [Bacteroidia bacterium]